MWSHYGLNHAGVCIGLSTEKIRPNSLRRVKYADKVPILDVRNYVGGSSETFVQLSLTKSKYWSYEKEWRTCGKRGPRRFPDCVAKVIIGALTPDHHKEEIRKAASEAPQEIEILEAKLSDTHYAIEIKCPQLA
jgi:hypothetical protein